MNERPDEFCDSVRSRSFKAAFVFGLFAFASGSALAERLLYGFPKCEFSVQFPSQPLRQRLQVEGAPEIEQATTTTTESFLRAECLSLAPALPIDEAQALSVVRKYALNQGLQGIETRFQRRSIGPTTSIKGTKSVLDRRIAVDGQCIFGSSSVLCMLVGAPAEKYPTSETSDFLSSPKKIPLTSHQRWIPLGPGSRGASMFMDTWSLTRKDSTSQFVLLQEYQTPQRLPIGTSMKSATSHVAFYCIERKFKRYSMNAYSDSMGLGELVGTQPESGLLSVGDDNSESGILFARACTRTQ